MAKTSVNIRSMDYMKELDEIKIEFKLIQVITFGSETVNSDVDLLIISNDFQHLSIFKRKQIIKKTSDRFDPICLTQNEYNILEKSKSSLWEKISSNGRTIYNG